MFIQYRYFELTIFIIVLHESIYISHGTSLNYIKPIILAHQNPSYEIRMFQLHLSITSTNKPTVLFLQELFVLLFVRDCVVLFKRGRV